MVSNGRQNLLSFPVRKLTQEIALPQDFAP